MSERMPCERECEALAQTMIREGVRLRDVLDTLRAYWFAEWENEREMMGKQFNGAQDGARKP